jgi:DNA-binding HxlR family transcriptional regulator
LFYSYTFYRSNKYVTRLAHVCKKIPQLFDCGILLTEEVLNGKWKTALLYNIAMGVQRPSAIQRRIPHASRRVLNVQFNELEQHGLVGKRSTRNCRRG